MPSLKNKGTLDKTVLYNTSHSIRPSKYKYPLRNTLCGDNGLKIT